MFMLQDSGEVSKHVKAFFDDKFSFNPSTIKLWNDLPSHIVDCRSLDDFKDKSGMYFN